MKKTSFLVILSLFMSAFASGQNTFHSTYSWEKNPKVYVPTEEEKKSDLVIVAEKKIIEVAYDSDGQAVIYETIHHIYHVNNPKAVDGVNKGYMPLRNILEEVDLKARCITPQNKVIYFNKSGVKSVDDMEGAGPYKIFAIDGVDNGCDVEILYTNKKQFSAYSYYYVQSRSPLAYFETRLISPKNLIFDAKAYNGLENFKSDTSNSEKNHLYLIHKNIPSGEGEKYSADRANYMGYIYQLSYNTDKKKSKLYTWDIISRDLYTSLFTVEKSEAKAVEKLLDKNKISKVADQTEKVMALDSYIKTNFEIHDSYEMTLGKAIDSKKMDYGNCVRFYIAALRSMQVPFELVLTSARDELKFDPKFPTYIFMKEYLIYFPDINKYVSPVSLYSRPGFPEPSHQYNNGLFIREVSLGDILSSTAKTKFIGSTDYKDSYHNMTIVANLDFNNKSAKLDVTHSVSGYGGYYVQPIYRYLNNEQKESIHKNYHLTENAEGIKNLEVLQTSEEDLFKKPMLVKYTTEQNDFLENAGTKFIFKVGLTIGPQSELYQEEKRKWPGDIYYTHYLDRTIEINIPDGYKAINLQELNMNKVCMVDNKEAAVFKSSYEVKGNKLIIKVYEDYQVMEYPLPVFDSFKAVINAAADFNKKTVIFEKQ